jgi:hypothetical protein
VMVTVTLAFDRVRRPPPEEVTFATPRGVGTADAYEEVARWLL